MEERAHLFESHLQETTRKKPLTVRNFTAAEKTKFSKNICAEKQKH